jgi:hypothetical protein
MAQTLRPPSECPALRVDEWFNQEAHPRSAILGAMQSRLPGHPAVIHQERRHGTSMLHSGRDSLVALTAGETACSSIRAPTVAGARGTSQQRILEPDHSGALQVPPIRRPPEYQCIFWFLHCNKTFDNEVQWKAHLERHFGGAGPPKSNTCCFCTEKFEWKELLRHLKTKHFVLGHRVGHCRLDFELVNYLKNKRIITDQDWKDLQGTDESRPATASLSGLASTHGIGARYGVADTPYMVMHNSREDRRRQSSNRR